VEPGPSRALRSLNPLLTAWQEAVVAGRDPEARDELVRAFAFAIPDEPALAAVRRLSPAGVVEVGAGTGYWARLLEERGVDVLAVDASPPPGGDNPWFAAVAPWTQVAPADESIVDEHADRTLLLVWPTRDETWAADAVARYAAAGGQVVLHVGEPPGGRTGDDLFHALLGSIDRCWACAYDVPGAACVCGTVPLFEVAEEMEIPRWHGFEDRLWVHRRVAGRTPLGPKRPRRSRRWSTSTR
jgi:hypothetical protein